MGMSYPAMPPLPDGSMVQHRAQVSESPLPNRSLVRGYYDGAIFVTLLGVLAAAILHAMGAL